MIGTALDEVSTAGWDTTTILSDRLIHLSSNPEHLNRSYMARLVIVGSLELVLEPFADLLERHPRRRHLEVPPLAEGFPEQIQHDPLSPPDLRGPVHPGWLMLELARRCPEDTRVLMDSGNSFLWGIHYWPLKKPKEEGKAVSRFHTGIGFSSMGWAIGACVGVASATDSPVVCITGDGSYLMSGQELTTALQENLNVMLIVLNDASLGMVRHGQMLGGAESIGHRLPAVNFAQMAAAMGIEAYRIDSLADLKNAPLEDWLQKPGPCLLDIRIDLNAIPPIGSRLKVLQEESERVTENCVP